MRSAVVLVLLAGLAACGTPPLDTERRPAPSRPAPPPPPARAERPPPPPPPRPVAAPEPVRTLPAVPRASIVLKSVYPEQGLTEWTLANGARVVFHRTDGPVSIVARAPGGAAGLPPETAALARGAAAVRAGTVRPLLADTERRLEGEGDVTAVASGLAAILSGSAPVGSGPPRLPASTALADFRQDTDGGPRVFAETFAEPAAYLVAVVGDEDADAIEAYVAAAFTAAGRRTLAFAPSDAALPGASRVVDAGTGRRVASVVYRGALRTGEGSGVVALAAEAARRALADAGLAWTVSGRADRAGGLYEIVLHSTDPARSGADDVARAVGVLAGARVPPVESLRALDAAPTTRAQHVLNWAASGASSLRFVPFELAVAEVTGGALARFAERAFGGAHTAVLGLTFQ